MLNKSKVCATFNLLPCCKHLLTTATQFVIQPTPHTHSTTTPHTPTPPHTLTPPPPPPPHIQLFSVKHLLDYRYDVASKLRSLASHSLTREDACTLITNSPSLILQGDLGEKLGSVRAYRCNDLYQTCCFMFVWAYRINDLYRTRLVVHV